MDRWTDGTMAGRMDSFSNFIHQSLYIPFRFMVFNPDATHTHTGRQQPEAGRQTMLVCIVKINMLKLQRKLDHPYPYLHFNEIIPYQEANIFKSPSDCKKERKKQLLISSLLFKTVGSMSKREYKLRLCQKRAKVIETNFLVFCFVYA